MITIYYRDQVFRYAEHTRYLELARQVQKEYPNQIILAQADGKLQELNKYMKDQAQVRFVTTAEPIGIMTYRRSTEFLLMKALYDVIPAKELERVIVDFSLSKGLFCRLVGSVSVSDELLQKVEERMYELAKGNLPIEKETVSTDEAIERFHKHRMYDKENLFHYRRVSRVNLYRINEFEDYYYGYMAPSTGYLKYFKLYRYEDGFVLQMPMKEAPDVVPPFEPQHKVYRALRESADWGEKLGVPTVGKLNDRITQGGITELILVQEALMEKKMGEIAEAILKNPDKRIVMIAGPSSSGKTTFSHRLSIQLRAQGLIPHPIPVDNYFVNRVDSPRDENGDYNYEDLECIDVKKLNEDLNALLRGETVAMPTYNFVKGEREYRGDTLTLGANEILVLEGIHCLNDKLTPQIPPETKYKIYMSALTQLNVDEHNRVPTTDGRLIRRMVRDARTRGASASETINRWQSVRRGEEKNIFPYQETADVVFNSALIYELGVLKTYAEPLLFGIQRNAPEYVEAKRLLKFLDYFVGIPGEEIPKNSILREFIGGSCFHV
ncbi:MAG: nucleoside kinase [Lachnospiraceae bacterium]|nr:nucleoside kinase [Lachnospiraceae bacterium]